MELHEKLGLSTFPINYGMVLGKRSPQEIEWLLDHGTLQSDLYSYKKLIKISGWPMDEYRLVWCKDSRYSEKEETLCAAAALQTLIEMEHLDIAYWYWFPRQ